MGEALAIYVAAMGYPVGTESHRAAMWAEHALRPGWAAVAALQDAAAVDAAPADAVTLGDRLVGIAYGYRSARGQWWSEEVRAGLLAHRHPPVTVDDLLADAFELTELHVLPDCQGHRLGEQLLAAVLRDRSEQRVVLSTPEVPGEDNRAWRLYRRTGFVDVLRDFRFTGDPRPFAVLARELR